MIRIVVTFILTFSNLAFAQDEGLAKLESRQKTIDIEIQTKTDQKHLSETLLKSIEQEILLAQSNEKKNKLFYDLLPSNQESSFSILKMSVDDELKRTKINLKKLNQFSKNKDKYLYRKFLKCINKSLTESIAYYQLEVKKCKAPKNVTKTIFLELLSEENKFLLYKKRSARERWNKETYKIKSLKRDKTKVERNLRNINYMLDAKKKLSQDITKKIKRVNFEEQYKEFHACNSETPTIDLEAETIFLGSPMKGPFHKIGRDNQDGVGSCYANTAKNLLIGLSQGKDDASFLDMALQYKSQSGKNLGT